MTHARGTRPILQGTSGTAYAGRGGDMGRRWGGGSHLQEPNLYPVDLLQRLHFQNEGRHHDIALVTRCKGQL
jgi:hypothetical protein